LWADHAFRLLTDVDLYRRISVSGFEYIQKYDFKSAADGLKNAFEFAMNN